MVEATAASCCRALIAGWIQRFGLPVLATSDNGNTFIAGLWKDLHTALGVQVAFTPPYHLSSLGGVERQHRDIKIGLKTALYQMGDQHGESWMKYLPWVMLARRTAVQSDIGASPAELALGMNPHLQADLCGEQGPPTTTPQVKNLLEGLRHKAAQPAHQPSHHGTQPTNHPNLDNVTHVLVRKGKPATLGHYFDGPFEIVERLGDSCLRLRVGSYASGEPRFEIQHWSNCRPAHMSCDTPSASRPKPGRKLNAKAPDFEPDTTGPPPGHPFPISTGDTAGQKNAQPGAHSNSGRPKRERRPPVRYG